MTGLTDFITTTPWSDIFTVWFVLVDDAYQALEADLGKARSRGPRPGFSDSEVITVALIGETYFTGNEEKTLCFIRQYHRSMFPRLLPKGQFNYRRRMLMRVIELIRRYLVQRWQLISQTDRVRIIDSAPVTLSTYTRGGECQSVCGAEFFGRCTSKGAKYFGVKLCLTTSSAMVVDRWLLAPASMHDSNFTQPLLESMSNMTVLSDSAFHKRAVEEDVAEQGVELLAQLHKNAREPWPKVLQMVVAKLRRRIETSLSVLQTVFNIEQPGSRSELGLFARTATKLLAYTLCFLTQPMLDACAS